ncbi:MAG TPA: hypothetical protein VN260_00140 [Dissulfurispiraceae bacterium]|nr:hypothetical protein [Dissulfurispiraceae bacterium]
MSAIGETIGKFVKVLLSALVLVAVGFLGSILLVVIAIISVGFLIRKGMLLLRDKATTARSST